MHPELELPLFAVLLCGCAVHVWRCEGERIAQKCSVCADFVCMRILHKHSAVEKESRKVQAWEIF